MIDEWFGNLVRADLELSFWDVSILALFVVGTGLYIYVVSRGKVLALLVTTYIAFVLVKFNPFFSRQLAAQIGLKEVYLLNIVLFVVIFLITLFVLSRVIFQSPVGAETFGWTLTALFSLTQVGFLIAIFVSFLPAEITQTFNEYIQLIFAQSNILFYWAVAPIVILLFLGNIANRKVG